MPANDDQTAARPACTAPGATRPGGRTEDPPISATPQLDLTLVLPDGSRQPISVPAGAEAGRAAARIAQTLDLQGDALSGWSLVRERSGAAIPSGVLLGDAGLLPDEALRLVGVAPAEGSARPPLPPPANLSAPAPPPPGAPAAGWGPQTPATSAPRRGGAVFALAGGFVVLVAVVAVLATLLLTQDSGEAPVAEGPKIDFGETPDPASAEPESASTAGGSSRSSGSGSSSSRAGLGATPLSQSGGVTSYSVELPSWPAAAVDEVQDSGSSAVTRSHTKLNAPTGGASIVVDSLRGFDMTAQQNRAFLDNSYAASQPAYRRVAFLSVPIGSTTGYEWRYVVHDQDKGRLARRANVMFDLGGMSFAVMASGTTSTPYAELSTLARRVARSVTP